MAGAGAFTPRPWRDFSRPTAEPVSIHATWGTPATSAPPRSTILGTPSCSYRPRGWDGTPRAGPEGSSMCRLSLGRGHPRPGTSVSGRPGRGRHARDRRGAGEQGHPDSTRAAVEPRRGRATCATTSEGGQESLAAGAVTPGTPAQPPAPPLRDAALPPGHTARPRPASRLAPTRWHPARRPGSDCRGATCARLRPTRPGVAARAPKPARFSRRRRPPPA